MKNRKDSKIAKIEKEKKALEKKNMDPKLEKEAAK